MSQLSRDAGQVAGLGATMANMAGMAGVRQYPCCSVEAIEPESARPGRGLQVHDHPRNVTFSGGAPVSGSCSPRRGPPPRERRRESDAPRNGAHRSKDDSSRMEAGWTTTFGDSRRQDSGPAMGSGDGDLPVCGRSLIQLDLLQDKSWEILMTSSELPVAVATDRGLLMRLGSVSRKVSVNTTRNDKMQNRLDHHQFRRGPCRFLGPPIWWRSLAGGHETDVPRKGERPACHRLNRRLQESNRWFP